MKVKPGRATDFCRAIHDNLSIWRAQPGFVDEIVVAEPAADHIVAQSFWSTKEDADRFNAEVFPRITAIVKDIMAAPPKSVTYQVAVSTNRNIVPEDELAKTISHRSQSLQGGNLAAQAIKLPPAIMISGLELFLKVSRSVQNVYNGTVDEALSWMNAESISKYSSAGDAAPAREKNVVRDTLNGLIAFVVPGPDEYSVAQGESTAEPGGCDAGILDALITTINAVQPATPQDQSPAAILAEVLNQVAGKINPSAQGPFLSAFARLSIAEKAAVFQAIEADPQTRPLAAVLVIVAFLAYSEGSSFNPQTRTISSRPLGWKLSNYEGVADGRNEFKGYFQNRQSVDASSVAARS